MIDLHKHLRKYEILQTPFRNRFGYKYYGLQKAKLEDQVLYDKDTGRIIKTFDKEKNNLDSICKKHDIIWGCDLITMIKYSKQNKNYKYVLTVIDFFSKYSWCYPLKSKKSEEIINSLKDIFKKSKRKPTMIQSDEGTEFTNSQTQTFFKNNNIKWYHTFNRDIKCSI